MQVGFFSPITLLLSPELVFPQLLVFQITDLELTQYLQPEQDVGRKLRTFKKLEKKVNLRINELRRQSIELMFQKLKPPIVTWHWLNLWTKDY